MSLDWVAGASSGSLFSVLFFGTQIKSRAQRTYYLFVRSFERHVGAETLFHNPRECHQNFLRPIITRLLSLPNIQFPTASVHIKATTANKRAKAMLHVSCFQ